MKIRIPSPTSPIGAVLYGIAGTTAFTVATAVLHHVHISWH